MGDLLLHTSVTWINPPASLGKWKKEPQIVIFGMTAHIYMTHSHLIKCALSNVCVLGISVFKTAVVFVCKDGSKQKKKMVGLNKNEHGVCNTSSFI